MMGNCSVVLLTSLMSETHSEWEERSSADWDYRVSKMSHDE